ncbi:hypothetical protein V8F20_001779 [Naviculisporaceae sp. PSN 640]
MANDSFDKARDEEMGAKQYGDREDEVDLHKPRHHNGDEEAQLLDGEEYDQFELAAISPDSDSGEQQPYLPRTGGSDGPTDGRQGGWSRSPPAARPQFLSLLYGPAVPKAYSLQPIFPVVQEAPVRLLDRLFPRRWQKSLLLAFGLLLYAVVFMGLLIRGKGAVMDSSGKPIVHLDCVDTFWHRNNECGLNGMDCEPFTNETFTFRCPANCAGVRVLNPRHVGRMDVNYRPLVIGGPVYRGDSFVCGSAIHAGIIDDSTGGCGTVSLIGKYYSFYPSEKNGIESIAFDSYFPLSFKFDKGQCGDSSGTGQDPRKALLAVSVFSTTVLSLFTTSPAIFFFTNFIGVFAHVALVSDPPNVSGPSETILPSLISIFLGRLLPSLFCAAILYQTCAKHTLSNLVPSAQIEKTVLWLGGLWFGALSNYTLDWIPLSRLTAHDLAQQPGARVALAVILIILTIIVSLQTYHFWRSGLVPRYLTYYMLAISFLLTIAFLPGLELRIHHYILALLLLPLTSIQTRPSMLYQGVLLGLFVNGIARWGFDSILQTQAALQGDALLGSLIPVTRPPTIYGNNMALELETQSWTISFIWAPPPDEPSSPSLDGISVLVNDVERYRAFYNDYREKRMEFTWVREMANLVTTPEYFRFAYVTKEGKALDYSEAGTWFANGTYSEGEGYWR